jgi:hypothetical protein
MVAKLSRENAYRKALEVYDTLPAIGLMADTAITNAAISACDKGKQSYIARFLLYTDSPDSVTFCGHYTTSSHWSGRSSTCCYLLLWRLAGGQWQQAMAIFHKMEAQGLRRDAITYSSTISALAKGKQWSLALQVIA